MSARPLYIPLGRLGEFVPEHPERTTLRAGKSWDSDYEVRVWPSEGAMLTACRMTNRGILGERPLKPWSTTRYAQRGAA